MPSNHDPHLSSVLYSVGIEVSGSHEVWSGVEETFGKEAYAPRVVHCVDETDESSWHVDYTAPNLFV